MEQKNVTRYLNSKVSVYMVSLNKKRKHIKYGYYMKRKKVQRYFNSEVFFVNHPFQIVKVRTVYMVTIFMKQKNMQRYFNHKVTL